ncbi:MAG: 16S rRNA (adenine(1518)-N(6)/adenine(1519)-N(6))-dimethyltransferase RsmA [Cyanobacteria bacterium P01_G01_bin.54]
MNRPRKRFAQHWLRSEAVLERIVEAADLSASDRILEIGPGTGTLTQRILPGVQALTAVEIDRDLCKKLVRAYGDADNFLLLQGDILDPETLAPLARFPKFEQPNKVVANIPYNITGPILQFLLGTIAQPNPRPYQAIVLLVQREIGDRLTAQPGTKAYGALTVRVRYLADCEIICPVPRKAFYPAPKVESAVIRLLPHVPLPVDRAQHLETLVKVGFSSRRKMLKNNLKSLMPVETLNGIFEQVGIPVDCRAETLSVTQWIALSNQIVRTVTP